MRGLLVLFLFAGFAAGLRAQPGAPPALSHALRAGGGGLDVLQRPAAPSYDVVALRVEFQPDTSRFTTGPGVFTDSLFRGIEVAIDPLPHDAGYFQAHLDFLADYVERVSDGRTLVETHLVPEVVRVSQPMAAYSPTGFDANADAELVKLAALVREAWALASEQADFDVTGFDPERTAFVLFHAGAGRDIELTGTSLDRTPQDLPSLFFNGDALTRLSPGDPIAFDGFPVTNTLVLPETESRLGRDFIADVDFVAEFSINGLLAASFFSYLGVPDLFDTETGESAIGPFGLMDPLGIFALRGLFPPEPSAWTKQFLGWADVAEADPALAESFAVAAASILGASDVVRVPISGAEYFLVENRQRAPEADELVLTVYRDGALTEQRIALGADGFAGFDVDAFEGGVVVAADPYDWALPGGRDAELGRFDGGLLIWHVDERVIRDGIADNRVNTDPGRRGVDLEEADGAQDLGMPSDGTGAGAELGTPFDFWFEGNPVAVLAEGDTLRLYQNRFGPDTVPSSDANGGGSSFAELADFSASGPTMSFVARTAADAAVGITPRTALFQDLGLTADTTATLLRMGTGDAEVVAVQADTRPGQRAAFRLIAGDGTPLLGLDGAFAAPAVTPDGYIAVLGDSFAGSFRLRLFDATGEVMAFTYEPDGTVKTLRAGGPLIPVGEDFYVVAETDAGGRLLRLQRQDGALSLLGTGAVTDVRSLAYDAEAGLLAVGPEGVWAERASGWRFSDDAVTGAAAFGRDGSGLVGVVPRRDGTLRWLLADGASETLDVVRTGTGASRVNRFPTLADLDNDGRLDAVTAYDSTLIAFTQGGGVVVGFPIAVPASVIGRPVVAVLAESAPPEVLIGAGDGSLYAYDLGNRSRLVPGFPLPVGLGFAATPRVDGTTLLALTSTGTLQAWTLDAAGPVTWGGLYADAANTSVVEVAGEAPDPSGSAGLLDVTETYNWPNPIRDGRTFLRFETAEAADVTITIVDLAGAIVTELTADTEGGTPSEIEWRTDAPSGVYFARVTARAASGREATHLIRMALIR